MDNPSNKFLTLFLLLSAFFISGCTAVLIGGAGVVGYNAHTDNRSLNVISEDASITASVKATLIKDAKIDAFDINVDTYRSVVTLHGYVKTTQQLIRATRLSQSISGVKKVISKLKVIK